MNKPLKLPGHMKFLIVDDQKTMRRVIKNLMQQLNIENVDEAADGQEALQKLVQNRYDVILSDWNIGTDDRTGISTICPA